MTSFEGSNGGGSSPLHVAIIGGGITGITLALGLEARGVNYTIFERSAEFREIGAGVGFSPNAEAALLAVDPKALAAYKRVATPNGEDYFQWVDGHSSDQVIYKLYCGKQGFQGCRRSDFLNELVRLVPAGRVQFSKDLVAVEEDGGEVDGHRLRLRFRDGTSAPADLAVGCDGIHSRTRQLVLGDEHPGAGYSRKFCFRALIPMERARATAAAHRTHTRFMFNGPDAHIITYPIGLHGEVMNTLLVISDPNPWQGQGEEDAKDAARLRQHTASGTKSEAVAAFAAWHPTVRAIVDLLPDELDKWAIFDMLDHPAPSYARGRVAIAGDAAHAAGPHLGAGAGFGMEDALFLCELLREAAAAVVASLSGDGGGGAACSRAEVCRRALDVYSSARIQRTQWLVAETRNACALFQWQDPEGQGRDPAAFGPAIEKRFHAIWNYDIDGEVKRAVEDFGNSILS